MSAPAGVNVPTRYMPAVSLSPATEPVVPVNSGVKVLVPTVNEALPAKLPSADEKVKMPRPVGLSVRLVALIGAKNGMFTRSPLP